MKRKVNKTKKVAILTVGLVSLFSTAIPMVSNATTKTRTAQGTYYDYLVVETEDGNEWLLDDSTESKYVVKNKDGVPYVDVYTPNYEWLGMAPRRAFAILKTEDEARETLEALKRFYPGMETLYEDVIVSAIGEEGLYALRQYHLIETCGNFNGRKLYAI